MLLLVNYPIKTPQTWFSDTHKPPSGWMSQKLHLGRTPGKDEAVYTTTIVKELRRGGK